jgi:hypothetical protein
MEKGYQFGIFMMPAMQMKIVIRRYRFASRTTTPERQIKKCSDWSLVAFLILYGSDRKNYTLSNISLASLLVFMEI